MTQEIRGETIGTYVVDQ